MLARCAVALLLLSRAADGFSATPSGLVASSSPGVIAQKGGTVAKSSSNVVVATNQELGSMTFTQLQERLGAFNEPVTEQNPSQHADTIFVLNIPFSASEQDLVDVFSEAIGDRTVSAKLAYKSWGGESGKKTSRGFGWVQFSDSTSVDVALSLTAGSVKLDGRKLTIERNKPYDPDTMSPKKKQKKKPPTAKTVNKGAPVKTKVGKSKQGSKTQVKSERVINTGATKPPPTKSTEDQANTVHAKLGQSATAKQFNERTIVKASATKLGMRKSTMSTPAPPKRAGELEPRQLTRRLKTARTTERILALYLDHAPSFNSINRATALHEIARMDKATWEPCLADPRFAALVARIEQTSLSEFNDIRPQSLTQLVWSYATLSLDSPQLFEAVGAAALPLLGLFKPQDLASLAWGYAKAGIAAPALFAGIADEAKSRSDDFYPASLAILALAFAEAGSRDPALFEVLAASAAPRISKFSVEASSDIHSALVIVGMGPLLEGAAP